MKNYIPFKKAHVWVDRGRLWLNTEGRMSGYTDCGKETDYPAGGRILWSPSESNIFDGNNIANGCILHFEIFDDDGRVHKGTILVEQFKKAENEVWFYKVTLAQTDTGLVITENEELGGGCILKLP